MCVTVSLQTVTGLCEVCHSVECKLMAFPGLQKGTVQIVVCSFLEWNL